MKRLASVSCSLLVLAATLSFAGRVMAFPALGQSCASCHSADTQRAGAAGASGTESVPGRLDGGTADPLKVFTVRPGETVSLGIEVARGGAVFVPMVFGLGAGGVMADASNHLGFTPDPAWTDPTGGGSNPFWIPASGTVAGTGNLQTFQFLLGVAADTPEDYYAVWLGAVGRDGDPGRTRWSQFEEVYVRVSAVPEPSSVALFLFGLFAMLAGTRRHYARAELPGRN